MARSSSVQIWSLFEPDDSSSPYGTADNGLLGQLLGHLIVCWTSKVWEIQQEALLALHHLCRFIQQQKGTMSPQPDNHRDDPEHSQGEGKREAGKPSWLSLCSTRGMAKTFGKYLRPADKTFIILRAIEAMRDSCVCDKEELISIVNVAEAEPASWLTEVSVITRCIHNNLHDISTASARHSLNLLLLSMAKQDPREMILSLTDISPACDRVTQDMWEVLLSQLPILVVVLRELNSNLQHLQLCWPLRFHRLKACIQLLILLVSSDVTPEEFAQIYSMEKCLRLRNGVLFSLTLQALVTLSQSPKRARKILVLLPELIDRLRRVHSKNRMKMLLVFRNLMGHVKIASSTALQLAEKLPQLFDDESSEVRELSICLFKEIIQMANCMHKRQMQKNVQESLVPLVLHMSDETESVAKASQEALYVAAKVLKWKWLSHHPQAHEIWRTAECLLEHDRSRAEKYARQSMAYLQHAQGWPRGT
ncbi:uncharacterized protein AAGF69_012223 isoform 2-T2 [Amazona ochrocephala]